MKKKMVFVLSMFVVAMTVTSVFPASVLIQSKEMHHRIILANLNKKIIHPHPVAMKLSKAFNMPPLPKAILQNVPIANSDDDEVLPSIAKCSGNNFVTIYADQPDLTTSSIVFAISSDGGNSWEYHPISGGGYNIDPAVAYRGNGNMAVATWGYDVSTYPAAHALILLNDTTDSSTWSGGYYLWSNSYNVFDWHGYDIAGYYSNDYPEFWGILGFIGNVDDDQWTHSTNSPFIVTDGTKWYGSGYVVADTYPQWNNSRTISVGINKDIKRGYAVFDFLNETVGTYSLGIISMPMETTWDDNAVWYSVEISSDYFTSYSHPDISIAGGRGYIVAEVTKQGNTDIVCFTSTDGFNTTTETFVANSPDNETNPHIFAYGDIAQCIFTKNGNLYETHTSDGGATWSEPQKINDQDGTVESGWHTSDLTSGGNVAWVDNRNGNADIYFSHVGVPAPIIEIKSLSGGFGVKATISNTGTLEAKNLPWSIEVSGSLVILGKTSSGTIDSLPPGSSVTIKSGLLFGIGSVKITVNAGSASKSATGLLLGPLVLGVK